MPVTTETLVWFDGDTPRYGERVIDTRTELTGLVDKEGKPTTREVSYLVGSVNWPADEKKAKKLTADEKKKHFSESGKVAGAIETVATEKVAQKWTAELVASQFPAAELKATARTLGLSVAGGEVVVAQRLLDSGWLPDFTATERK